MARTNVPYTGTAKEIFTALLALDEVQANDNFVVFIEHQIDKLATKKSGGGKLSKATLDARANEQDKILAILGTEGLTATDIANKAGLGTSQRASARLKELLEDGKVVVTEAKIDKRKAKVWTIAN